MFLYVLLYFLFQSLSLSFTPFLPLSLFSLFLSLMFSEFLFFHWMHLKVKTFRIFFKGLERNADLTLNFSCNPILKVRLIFFPTNFFVQLRFVDSGQGCHLAFEKSSSASFDRFWNWLPETKSFGHLAIFGPILNFEENSTI